MALANTTSVLLAGASYGRPAGLLFLALQGGLFGYVLARASRKD